jgi:hypothetical protein
MPLTERIAGQTPGNNEIDLLLAGTGDRSKRMPNEIFAVSLRSDLGGKKRRNQLKKNKENSPPPPSAIQGHPPTTAGKREGGWRRADNGRVEFPRVCELEDLGIHDGGARQEDRAQGIESGDEEEKRRFHDLDCRHIKHG